MGFWKKKGSTDEQETNPAPVPVAPPRAPSGKVSVAPSGQTSSTPSGATPSPSASSDPSERFGKVRSALGVGTVIQGKLSFDTPVRIDGKLTGEIYSTKPLIVGDSGHVEATVQVSSLLVMGVVVGNITALERIEIVGKGEIRGDVITPVLVIEDGAKFNGSCSMSKKRADAAAKGSPKDEPKPAQKSAVVH